MKRFWLWKKGVKHRQPCFGEALKVPIPPARHPRSNSISNMFAYLSGKKNLLFPVRTGRRGGGASKKEGSVEAAQHMLLQLENTEWEIGDRSPC